MYKPYDKFSKTKLEKSDINLIILKQIKDFSDDEDLVTLNSFINKIIEELWKMHEEVTMEINAFMMKMKTIQDQSIEDQLKSIETVPISCVS